MIKKIPTTPGKGIPLNEGFEMINDNFDELYPVEYDNISQLFSNQDQQIKGKDYYVKDASKDTNLNFSSGENKLQAVYKYKGTIKGKISDYVLISSPYGLLIKGDKGDKGEKGEDGTSNGPGGIVQNREIKDESNVKGGVYKIDLTDNYGMYKLNLKKDTNITFTGTDINNALILSIIITGGKKFTLPPNINYVGRIPMSDGLYQFMIYQTGINWEAHFIEIKLEER